MNRFKGMTVDQLITWLSIAWNRPQANPENITEVCDRLRLPLPPRGM